MTGPKGEEVHCNHYGRVKVQFHRNREDQADDSSSYWLHVASDWTGKGHGAIVISRVGMGVLVAFLEGDPDQSLVTGCPFRREHPVSYELPAHKVRSILKSPSSPGGGDYNELHIKDRKDQEQTFVHAQRDWDEDIGRDQKIHVSHQRHGTVETNSYGEFKAGEHHTTYTGRRVEVHTSDHLTAANDQHLKTASDQSVEVDQEIRLSSGLRVVLKAGAELTLKDDGSFLRLDTSGVTLSGASVRVDPGGSPGSNNGAAPLLSGPPLDADAATVGQVLGNPARSRPERKGPEQLTVDAWGDPAQGSQTVLLPSKSEVWADSRTRVSAKACASAPPTRTIGMHN